MTVRHHLRPQVTAVLGPTNTGKTHFAVERMLAHPSGMIGCPLRLLAREIYDRIVIEKGPSAVALITGEERIRPASARYTVATVEAMPMDLEASFLAIDEIQLAADPERGHVFTDRLLHARGRDETVFLGADTIRPLLKYLVPEAEIVTRPRFSTLSYVSPVKVTRVPRRSALVAFTTQDVYALAELVRRHRGGAAVVLGALSPRTRNAQVALYQEGEVDYLIATDAIGMGLNMDLGHVTLASLSKFDGHERRRLHAHEIAQIAGRAGRYRRDGTFGTTHDVGGLDAQVVEAIETHAFPALKRLRWRNSDLAFNSLEDLMDSLDAPAPDPCLIKTRDAVDDLSLKLLARRPAMRERAADPAGVRLLWSVCQIPDFRKTLTESHLSLLDTIFRHLADRGRLQTDWVADHIARLDTTDGDIDLLIKRLAYIRTWTYVAYRAAWLDDAGHWQERARAVEDRLSDALHDRLTQRFVDRRTQALLKSLQGQGPMAAVERDGTILVDGHVVGQLLGLQYALERSDADLERRALAAAARRAVGPEIKTRARALVDAGDDAFTLDGRGRIIWHRADGHAPVAQLLPGSELRAPKVRVLASDLLSSQGTDAVRRRLETWLIQALQVVEGPLAKLEAADLKGAGRGLVFRLIEGLGNVAVDEARPQVKALGDDDRRTLTRLGVRFGVHNIYLPGCLKGGAIRIRALLWSVHHRDWSFDPPDPGRVAVRAGGLTATAAAAIGFGLQGGFALRIDILERLSARLRALARAGPFALEPPLMASTGLSAGDLADVVLSLGFVRNDDGQFERQRQAEQRRARRLKREVAAVARPHSPFSVLEPLRRSV